MIINKLPRHFFLVMISISIIGCQQEPKYIKPKFSLPNDWTGQYYDSAYAGAALGDVVYNDKRISSVVNIALMNNMDIEKAALNLKKIQELYGIERLTGLPTIDTSFSQTSAHEPSGLLDTMDTGALTYHQYDVKLVTTSWELDFWGRLKSIRDSALNQYLSSDASMRALKLSIKAQTISSYVQFLACAEKLKVNENRLENYNSIEKMQLASFNAGNISKDELTKNENLLSHQRQQISNLKLTLQKEYSSLKMIIGEAPPGVLVDNIWLSDLKNLELPKINLPSSVIEKRPDVIAAEYKIKSANADIGEARAAFFPNISLTASVGTASASLNKLFSQHTAEWVLSPNINIPIFHNGRNKSNLRIAEITKSIAIVDYKNTIRQAFEDVSNAIVSLESEKNEYNETLQRYARIEEKLNIIKISTKKGLVSSYEELEIENELLSLKEEKIDSYLRLYIAKINFFQSVGGLPLPNKTVPDIID